MRLAFAICGVALVLPFLASAQSLENLGSITGNAFTLSVNPQYPAPYSNATLSVLSDSLELANATLTVSASGKEIYKGAVRPVTVPLGKAGSIMNVRVTISSGSISSNQTVSLQPQDVLLIAEPVSSFPPLYPGKPFVPLEGSVRIIAIANLRDASGKTSIPATYSYAWTVDGARVMDSSGIGKSSIIAAAPLQYRTREISVTVTNAAGTIVGGASLSFSALEPSVHIYENDPLLGIRFGRALAGSYTMSGAEATFYAAPFSFPLSGGVPTLQWFLNGVAAQTGNLITLRPTGEGRGTASLSLTASSGNAATAAANLPLIFGAKPSTNFFGL
ncbi:TPA: hypothetical protein DIV48_02290 [Candidatus Kaiserbacteria bacterium]|nr:MAG: hypothetical protein UY93_C0001G0026 [Parcubacteria group bacterium GW2011_GWA1_56_13]KKW46993.1 MAG: hypothetical protein UY97_C0001G0050 [Parcubacteria group bacterium GW2011_GWB1_57_6]HCR52457.1 hypothetical protein [Candidatus Kaiserbacteria bacterium]